MPTDWTDTIARYITVPNTTVTTGYTATNGYTVPAYTTTAAIIDASATTPGNQYIVSTPYVTGTTTATGTAWSYATTNPHNDYVPVSHITYGTYIDNTIDDTIHDINVRTLHIEEKDIGVEDMEMDDDTTEIDKFLDEFTIKED